MKLDWIADPITECAARDYPLLVSHQQPVAQYAGHTFRSSNWQRRIMKSDKFLGDTLVCSPKEIIRHFQANQYLAGFALVVSWGGMARTAPFIYDRVPLQRTRDALKECFEDIHNTKSINISWKILTENLEWSAVMASKTLHFICRSLNYESNPPTAIDNAVIIRNVWPAFKKRLPYGLPIKSWSGKSFESYNRYMSAIIEWARIRSWTTTELEATLFAEYG